MFPCFSRNMIKEQDFLRIHPVNVSAKNQTSSLLMPCYHQTICVAISIQSPFYLHHHYNYKVIIII